MSIAELEPLLKAGSQGLLGFCLLACVIIMLRFFGEQLAARSKDHREDVSALIAAHRETTAQIVAGLGDLESEVHRRRRRKPRILADAPQPQAANGSGEERAG